MSEIINWTAFETAQNLAKRRVSVVEVTKAHLDRQDQIGPKINALVETFEETALAQAQALDNSKNQDRGALWGLPISVKINVDFAGHATNNGIPALNRKPVQADGATVANIKAMDPVILGRSNAPEFSLRWFTSNPLYGETINPVDPSCTPGGSSGGAAAAVAAGIGVMGHGNDLGGSLRNPAYCCGLSTLRPSLGRVPAFNPTAAERPMVTAMMSVQGMIARSIGDVAMAMGGLSVGNSGDPLWTNARGSGRDRSRRALRVGYVVDPFGDGVHPDVAAAVDQAVLAAKDAGYEVKPVSLGHIDRIANLWGELLVAEIEHLMADTIRDYGSNDVIAAVSSFREYFGLVDMAGFIRCQSERHFVMRAWAQMFDDIDAVILPVSSQPPFRAEQDFASLADMTEILDAHRILYAINLLGLPAAAFPTIRQGNIPLGVQLVGAMREDDLILEMSGRIEAVLGLNIRPVTPLG